MTEVGFFGRLSENVKRRCQNRGECIFQKSSAAHCFVRFGDVVHLTHGHSQHLGNGWKRGGARCVSVFRPREGRSWLDGGTFPDPLSLPPTRPPTIVTVMSHISFAFQKQKLRHNTQKVPATLPFSITCPFGLICCCLSASNSREAGTETEEEGGGGRGSGALTSL